MSRSCHSATFSSAASAFPRRSRARPQIRSESSGFRLWGIALEPFCPSPNGSCASSVSVRWSPRTSSAIFSRDAPATASVAQNSAWRSRWTICVDTGAAPSPSSPHTSVSSSGSTWAKFPTAPESFPTATVARARRRAERVPEALLSRDEEVGGVPELERQRRVPDVARREADMDEARVRTDLLLEAREERDHLVFDPLLDGEDPRDVRARRLADARHRVGGDAAAAGVRPPHGKLHSEPRHVFGLLAPEAAHLRAGVTLDHALTLEQNTPQWKCEPEDVAGLGPRRPRRAKHENRASRRTSRVGGFGGPCRGPPISTMQFAREVAAIEGSERGQDEAVLVEEVGDERLHLLVADGVDRREHGVDREERAQVHLVLGEPIHPARRRLERQHQAALQMILGASELLLRHAALLYLTELLEDRLENLGEVRRVARGIDVERPRVDVRLDARMDRVDEPLALPHLLEEARGHAAADHVVQDEQGVTLRRRVVQAREAHDDVDLLERLVDDVDPGLHQRGRVRARCHRAGEAVEAAPEEVDDPVVGDVARDRDHDAWRHVLLAEVGEHRRAIVTVHRLARAEDRASERMTLPELCGEEVMDQVVGRVLHHLDLLEH